jgi:dihydroflavonol-4-reductase
MRALVTGAECFIGSHLVDALLERGIKPRLFVLRGCTTSNLPAGQSDLEIVRGDLLSGDGVDDAVEGIDTIFHLAAVTKGYDRRHFVGPNLTFMKNLIASLHKRRRTVHRLLFLSSLAATAIEDLDPGQYVDESRQRPPQLYYGLGKRKAEQLLERNAHGIPYTIIRAPTVYGPRDLKLLPYFQAVARGIRPLVGTGGQEFSLIFVQDLVDGMIVAADSPVSNRMFYLASQEVINWRTFTRYIMRAVGSRAVPVAIPKAVFEITFLAKDFANRLGMPASSMYWNKAKTFRFRRFVCSCERARREIGFNPKVTLGEGMEITVRWYRDIGYL